MGRSFLQVAATEEAAPPLRVVQIEGLMLEEDEEMEADGATCDK